MEKKNHYLIVRNEKLTAIQEATTVTYKLYNRFHYQGTKKAFK